jgi:hypothetical protein
LCCWCKWNQNKWRCVDLHCSRIANLVSVILNPSVPKISVSVFECESQRLGKVPRPKPWQLPRERSKNRIPRNSAKSSRISNYFSSESAFYEWESFSEMIALWLTIDFREQTNDRADNRSTHCRSNPTSCRLAYDEIHRIKRPA